MLEFRHMSVKDSIGAGAGGESGVTVTSTLSRNLTSSICSGLRRKTRSEGFHWGTTTVGTANDVLDG